MATANSHRSRNHFIGMIFTQVLATACFSLPWIIFTMYNTLTNINEKSVEEQAIMTFVFGLTNHWYYFNYATSFYLSTLTSGLFRRTLIGALIKRLPQHLCQRWEVRQINILMKTVPKVKARNIVQQPL